MSFPWKCPYCNHATTIVESNFETNTYDLHIESALGAGVRLSSSFIVCPNIDCMQLTLSSEIKKLNYSDTTFRYTPGEELNSWDLMPRSTARVFPEYIPASIKQDYEEACLIISDSPKASATLSRRCLQGVIRDFWGISKARLIDEINAIEDKIDPLTWKSIDAVRKVGNIGAHMEKDINLIIDVEPEEASLLIQLIELLFEEWYIHKHEREMKLNSIVRIAETKQNEKKPNNN